MVADGAWKNADSIFGQVKIRGADHHAGYVLRAIGKLPLLHHGVPTGGIDLHRDRWKAFVSRPTSDVFIPHEINSAARTGPISGGRTSQVAQDFVNRVAAPKGAAQH